MEVTGCRYKFKVEVTTVSCDQGRLMIYDIEYGKAKYDGFIEKSEMTSLIKKVFKNPKWSIDIEQK